mmetsp:Transcript_10732/g.38120  ORF Transcript_10732/g.38120 Transcript_10732/m.38120 type:complete len:217 (-) Transcript_10732:16-666(-)
MIWIESQPTVTAGIRATVPELTSLAGPLETSSAVTCCVGASSPAPAGASKPSGKPTLAMAPMMSSLTLAELSTVNARPSRSPLVSGASTASSSATRSTEPRASSILPSLASRASTRVARASLSSLSVEASSRSSSTSLPRTFRTAFLSCFSPSLARSATGLFLPAAARTGRASGTLARIAKNAQFVVPARAILRQPPVPIVPIVPPQGGTEQILDG